jgi:hypothetical protein
VLRRRPAVGVVTGGGHRRANVSAQLLKTVLVRPPLDVDVSRAAAGNSLPSGHTTAPASVVFALLLAVPPKLREAVALTSAVFVSFVGAAPRNASRSATTRRGGGLIATAPMAPQVWLIGPAASAAGGLGQAPT